MTGNLLSGKAVHVLLVEDDTGHAEVIRRAFLSSAPQAELTIVHTLAEARSRLAEFTPELVITDLLLPEGLGTELLPAGEVPFPVMVMTSFGNEQAAVDAMKAGALDYVVKSSAALADVPRTAERVLRQWEDIQERRRAERALQAAHDELERRVAERTAELAEANAQLKRESKERKQAEETLRRAERLASIGTLAAGIAHEINNPLGAITLFAGAAKRLLGQPDGMGTVTEALREIESQARRCSRIVKSVLQFGREQSRQKWPNDLRKAAGRARDLTHALAVERSVAVDLRLEDDLPDIVSNPTEMEQVFVNLIHNAVQASKPGDRVSVRIESAHGAIHAHVEDRGCGMSEEQLGRVFDPFYTTRSDEGGTGLGLSISYGIIENHGGTINGRSKPGEGTTFSLVLPLNPPHDGDA